MTLGILLASAGLLTAAGLLIALGIVGTNPPPTQAAKSVPRDPVVTRQMSGAAIGFVAGLVLTQLPAAAVLTAGAGALWPLSRAERHARDRHQELTSALAEWLEQLRDAVASDGAIETPLRRTASSGPEQLRGPLRELRADMVVLSTDEALATFARKVGHHIADVFVVAYRTAARDSTKGLEQLLDGLATSARDEAATYETIGTERRKTAASNRQIGILGGLLVGGAFVFAGDLLAVYQTLAGQAVMLVLGSLGLYTWLWRIQLSRIDVPPRTFAIEEVTA